MDITEVRVRLTSESAGSAPAPAPATALGKAKPEKLHAYASITIARDFVVRDIKVIGAGQGYFVAMPSRKLTDRCSRCGGKNHLRARFCNDCGAQLDPDRAARDGRGRARLHADVAHPINAPCREKLQELILAAFEEELRKSRLPGYVPQELHDEPDLHARGEIRTHSTRGG